MTTVLVVDDDPDVCDLVTFKLQKSGYEVRRATDGDEALSAVAAELPDIVLLDVMMPGPSGLEVLERWRASPGTANLPVILLTARAQQSDVETGFALGADDYILKPFSPRELARRVAAVLARSPVR
ncbi:MAG: two-component system, OmpR family, alkaline phosphatase synthesis response regulator PhoP [Streptosporangiaceae bacterium]|jgi:DNA-binding response OmpR family regulator|nr:two-component system, OmpR family, alkaline phosphatase synthesis response regulator PhoP [Streptosporangiaceae bacterium]